MSNSTRAILICAMVAACVLVAGCNGGKATSGAIYSVPIRVLAVVATTAGGPETLGSRSNVGCRLSEAEIRSIVHQAQDNACVFGTNTKLDWNEQIEVLVDPLATTAQGNYGRTGTVQLNFLFLLLTYPQFASDPTKVNIYFTGNFSNAFAATLDPSQAGAFPPGHLVINDAGFMDPNTARPEQIRSRLTLEHELGHYFGNKLMRQHTPFGAGQSTRRYNQAGHLADQQGAPVGGPYLMIDGSAVVGQTRLLAIPGKQVKTDGTGGRDELGDISGRIQRVEWNDP